MYHTAAIKKPRNVAERILDGVLDGTGSILSIKEAYAIITGDRDVTGLPNRMREESLGIALSDEYGRLTEAVSTAAFANSFANSINRRFYAFYPNHELHQVWRALAKIERVDNFRSHDYVRLGGYGNLPNIAEGAAYPALVSPTDLKGTVAVAKRGGTESITREAIKNDDVGMLKQIPIELALAAVQTLAEFVTDFVRTPPILPDFLPVFHTSKGNLGSDALNPVSYMVGFNAIRAQGRPSGSSEARMNLEVRNIWVPIDLEEAAFNMFQRNLNQDFAFHQSRKPNMRVVHWWEDVNDWYLTADADVSQAVVIAFLDGQEDPEIFVQDVPNAGSMFSNDKITLKIRHIYGGNVISRRGLYKSVVAG